MIRVEKDTIIDRLVEDVFAFVADQTNAPQWQDGLLEVRRTTDGPIGVGTQHTAVRTFMGRRLELTNEYVTLEPNREVAFTGASGPLTFWASYRVEPTTAGAKITSIVEMRMGGLFSVAERVVAGDLGRDMEANLRLLKGVLEQQPVSTLA